MVDTLGINKDDKKGVEGAISMDQNELKSKHQECEKTKNQMELALEAGDLGYWDWNLKTSEAYFNPTAHRMLGFKPGDIAPTMDAWMDLFHPDDKQTLLKRIPQYIMHGQFKPEEFRMRCKNGKYKWVSVKGKVYEKESDNQPKRALGVIYDIDKKKKEEHMRILIENIPTQVWYLTSPKKYGAVNAAHAKFIGVEKDKVEFQEIEQFFPEKNATILINHNQQIFQLKEAQKIELTLPNHLGEERLLLIHQTPKIDEIGEVEYLVCSAEDITEQRLAEKKLKESHEAYKRLSEKLHEASITDELTGLPNRRGFNQQLIKEWKRSRRNRRPLTVMIFDIDYFKYYNDSKGHLAGDKLLQKVANTVRQVFKRPSDFIARYGGDEFVAIIPDTDWAGGITLAETCRKALEKLKIPNKSAPFSNHVTISVGVATVDQSEVKNSEELMKKADEALYKAKNSGRNRSEYEKEE